MNTKNLKIVIDAKIRGQLNLTLPLILGQNIRTQKRFENLIMNVTFLWALELSTTLSWNKNTLSKSKLTH